MDAGQFFVEMNHKNEKSLKKVLLGAVWTLLDELRCNDAGLLPWTNSTNLDTCKNLF